MPSFADRLNRALKQQAVTQKAISDEIGITEAYMSQLSTGKRTPSPRTAKDLAEALGVNVEWLLEGVGEMSKSQDREAEIARLVNIYLASEPESFTSRFISMLSRLDEKQWEFLAKMAKDIEKKE